MVTVNIKLAGLDVSQPFKIWCAFSVFILALKLPQKKVFAPPGIPEDGMDFLEAWDSVL